MFSTITKFLGFRSSMSSAPRRNQKSIRRAFRPTFDSLELRDVPTASPTLITAPTLLSASADFTSTTTTSSAPAPITNVVVSGPKPPEILWDPPIGGEPPPNVVSGPSSPFKPNGPEPYRIFRMITPNGAMYTNGQNTSAPAGVQTMYLPFRVEVSGSKVTFIFSDGTRIETVRSTANGVTTTTTLVTTANGVKLKNILTEQPGRTTRETFVEDKVLAGKFKSVYYSVVEGNTKTEWVKSANGVDWTKTVTVDGVAGRPEPSIGPPPH